MARRGAAEFVIGIDQFGHQLTSAVRVFLGDSGAMNLAWALSERDVPCRGRSVAFFGQYGRPACGGPGCRLTFDQPALCQAGEDVGDIGAVNPASRAMVTWSAPG